MGGGGGCVFQKHFFIGGFGENTINNLKASGANSGSQLELNHGGFWIGYILPIGGKSNIFLSGQIGFGSSSQLKNAGISYYSNYTVVKPCAEFEYVFTNYFKIGTGLSWSFFNGADLPYWNDNSLSGFNFMLSFKFGWF